MKKIAIILILVLAGGISFAQKDNQNKNQQDTGKSQSQEKSKDQETRFNENSSGVKRSIAYRFQNASGVPESGIFMFNSGTVSEVTSVTVNDKDIKGEDQSQWYSTWDQTTGATARGQITLVDSEYRNIAKFDVTGLFTDMSGYWKIPVRYVSGGMPLEGQVYYYIFERIDHKKDEASTQPATSVTAQVNPPPQQNVEVPVPVEQPQAEVPVPVEQPQAQEPAPVEQPQAEVPAPVEQPQAEVQPPVEQPKAEVPPPVEQPKTELPAPVEQPKAEVPAPVEQPKVEVPAPVEQAKAEMPPPIEQPKVEEPEPAESPQAAVPKQSEPTRAGEPKPSPAQQTSRVVDPVSRRQTAVENRTTQTQPAERQPAQPVPTQRTQPPQQQAQPSTQTTTQTAQQVTPQPAQKSGTTWTTQVTQSTPSSQNSGAPPAYQSNLPTYQYRYSTGTRSAGKWYAGIIEAGYGLGVGEYGINNFRINFINGFHIGQTFSVGLGIGVRRYYFENEDFSVYEPVSGKIKVPVFLDLRKTFSTRKITPYLALGLGGSARFDSTADTTESQNEGFLFNPSGGIWFNISSRFAVFCGVAYEMQNMEFYFLSDESRFRKNSNSVSLNIGIAF